MRQRRRSTSRGPSWERRLTLLFTPPNSQRAMGTVVLKSRPPLPISPAVYRMLLAERLHLLITDAEGTPELDEVLTELERQEGLNLPPNRKHIGEILVKHSQRLRKMAGYPIEPI